MVSKTTFQLAILATSSADPIMNVWIYKFVVTSVSAQELRGLGYKKGKPHGLVGVTELSEDQKKQIKEQQEVWKHQLHIFLHSCISNYP